MFEHHAAIICIRATRTLVLRSKIQVLNNAGLTCGRSFTYLFGGNFLSSLEIAFSTLFRLSFFCSISNFCDTVPLQTILFIFGSTKVNIKIDAVTGTRRLGFCLFLPWKILTLCRRRQHDTAVTQRFVHFSTHPQPMQQHRKLSCRRNHGSLLPTLSAALGQLQSPAPQIAVRSKRT